MSTVTVTKLSDKAVPHTLPEGQKGYGVHEVDFAQVGNQVVIANGDTCILQVAPVKKGTLVHRVCAVVETPEGEAVAADIGDGDNDDGYLESAALNLNSAGFYAPAGAYETSKGKLYAADDTIDLKITNASGSAITLGTGKVKLIVEYYLTKGNHLQ